MNQLDQLPIPLLQWYRETPGSSLAERSHPLPRVGERDYAPADPGGGGPGDYYRFMEALPTVADLAAVERTSDEALAGPGLYNRACNLQKAARQMVDGFGGEFPAPMRVPFDPVRGGEYTAGPSPPSPFGVSVPAVDGNVLRVVSPHQRGRQRHLPA